MVVSCNNLMSQLIIDRFGERLGCHRGEGERLRLDGTKTDADPPRPGSVYLRPPD